MKAKRSLALLSAAIMLLAIALSFAACSNVQKDNGSNSASPQPDVTATPAPATDAPATEPPETETPATDAPVEGVMIRNMLGSAISELHFCDPEAESWGDAVLTELENEAGIELELDALGVEPGKECDVLVLTEDGKRYTCLNAVISKGDSLVFDGVNTEEMDIFCPTLTINGEIYLDLYTSEQEGTGIDIYSTAEYSNVFLDGTDILLVCSRWDELELKYTSSSKYPRLDQKLIEDYGFEYSASMTAQASEHAESMEEFYNEEPDLFFTSISNRRAFIRRADDAVLSILIETTYEDGEGYVFFESSNYCPRNGRPLALTDVVTDVSALPGLIAEQLEFRESGFRPDYNGDPAGYFTDPENTYYAWTLDPTGLCIFFNGGPFEINSVLIPYADNEDLFAEQYLDVPEDYTMHFPQYVPTYMDLHGDGELTEINCGRVAPREDGFSDELSIDYNGTENYPEVSTGTADFWFVHANGKNYLYCAAMDDALRNNIVVFDLNGRRPKLTDIMYAQREWHYMSPSGNEQNDGTVLLMTDPCRFVLDVPTEMPDFVSASAIFRVGENGMPELIDDMYRYSEDLWAEYAVLSDVELTLMSGGTITVRSYDGENTIFLIGTNNADRLLFCTEEGEAYLDVEYDPETGSITVDGTPLEELLEPLAVG